MSGSRHGSIWRLSLWVCLGLVLTTCRGGEGPGTAFPPATDDAGPTQLPESAPYPLATGASALTEMIPPPTFLYIMGNALILQPGGGEAQVLSGLIPQGQALQAIAAGEIALVLSEDGLQGIDLENNAPLPLISFDPPAIYGNCFPAANGPLILCQIAVTDPNGPAGLGTHIHLVQMKETRVHASLYYAANMQALGLADENRSLYLLPRGQDPSFGQVLVVDTQNGAVQAKLEVEGIGGVTLSPDRQVAVTTNLANGSLRVYSLDRKPPTFQDIPLPQSPSHSGNWFWSHDSKFLYLALFSGATPGDESPSSYGFWRIAVDSGSWTQIIEASPGKQLLTTSSPNGEWVLLQHTEEPVAIRMHTASETLERLSVPDLVIPGAEDFAHGALWLLSNDGQWLLYRAHNASTAAMINLATDEQFTFPLPAEAIPAGWR